MSLDYSPLPAADTSSPTLPAPEVWRPIIPAPPDQPPNPTSERMGARTGLWIYYLADGQVAGAVARWDPPDGKVILPVCYCEGPQGRRRWLPKAMPAPRPLYRLPELLATATAPVLVVEGEKAADAAERLLPEFVVTTSAGGSNAAGQSDWTSLAGRDVWIWRDNDAAGASYSSDVARHLAAVGARSIRPVEPPATFPPKWDLADPLPDGVTVADLRALLEAAPLLACSPANGQPQSVQPASVDSWRLPDLSCLRDQNLPAPPFPAEIFGSFWAGWLRDRARGVNAPVDYVAAGLLASASALLANVRRVRAHQDWTEAPILWCAIVGNPSAGKTPGLGPAKALLRGLEERLNEDLGNRRREYETRKLEAAERRKLWKSEVAFAAKSGLAPPIQPEGAVEPDPPQRRRLVTNDATTEAIAKLLAVNEYALLLEKDELAGWFGSMDRYSSTKGADRPFYLEAWNGSGRTVDRAGKDEPIHVRHLSVPTIGGIQPDKLQSLLMSGDDDGLPARFLYFWPEPAPIEWPDETGDSEAAHAALARLAELSLGEVNGRPAPRPVAIDALGAIELNAWRQELRGIEAGVGGLFMSWLGKAAGTALRLAVILEYLRWCGDRPGQAEPTTVSLDALRDAIRFMREYAMPMARRCFGVAAVAPEERDASVVARWLARRNPLPATVNSRDLRRMADGPQIKDPAKLDAALAVLAEGGWLRAVPSRAGDHSGRPRKDWAVNPRITELPPQHFKAR